MMDRIRQIAQQDILFAGGDSIARGKNLTSSFASRVEAQGTEVPDYVSFLRIAGQAVVGSGLDAIYERTEDALSWDFMSLDGAKWRFVGQFYTPEMYGAAGDGVTDDFNALPRLFNRWRGTLTNNGDGTATFNCEGTHDFRVGAQIKIIGTLRPEFDGLRTVTAVPNSTSWKFAITGAPTNDGNSQVRCFRPGLPRRNIFIPANVYATSRRFHAGDNQEIDCRGSIKYIGDNSQGYVFGIERVKDVTWSGGSIDANFKGNANNIGVGGTSSSVPATPNPDTENVRVSGVTVLNSRIATEFEASNNSLFSGGGKGVTIQFNTKNVIVRDIISIDCDIGISVEGTTANGRETPNLLVSDIVIVDAHRTPLFIAGENPIGYTSNGPGGPASVDLPGVVIDGVRVYGGCDQQVNVPGDAIRNNWEVCGVVTSNYSNGVKITNFVARMSARCTLIRGGLANSRLELDLFADGVETVFDGREIPTLTRATFDTNNHVSVWMQNKDPANSFGYIARGQASRFRNGVFEVKYRGFTGLGLVQDVNAFGPSVAFDILDMETPARRVIGNTDYTETIVFPASGTLILDAVRLASLRNGGGADLFGFGAAAADGVEFLGAAWNDRPLNIGGRKLWWNATAGVFRHASAPSSDLSGAGLSSMQTLTATDQAASPSVTSVNGLTVSSTVATNITGLTNGVDGQIVTMRFTNGNTTLVHNSATFRLRGAVNVTPAQNNTVTMQNFQGNWFEIARNF